MSHALDRVRAVHYPRPDPDHIVLSSFERTVLQAIADRLARLRRVNFEDVTGETRAEVLDADAGLVSADPARLLGIVFGPAGRERFAAALARLELAGHVRPVRSSPGGPVSKLELIERDE